MTRNLIAIMLAGAMLAPAGTAYAAKATGPEVTRTGHRLAECLYAKRKDDVLGVLGATSQEQAARYDFVLRKGTSCQDVKVTTRDIEGGSIDVPTDVFRGMLAEAALEQGSRARALAPAPGPESYTRDWFGVTGRDPAVDAMAVCTAEVNPAGVRALLGTTPDSADELAAAQSLSATLGPCLPQGATLKANRQSLRAAVAEALYHRANAPALATSK